jgi:hypothetical protein
MTKMTATSTLSMRNWRTSRRLPRAEREADGGLALATSTPGLSRATPQGVFV